MLAGQVVAYYTLFVEHGVQVWLDGGWGIDALLQQQTRPHKDLDLIARFEDLALISDLLAARDFHVSEIWSENRWVAYERPLALIGRATPGGWEAATAFVLGNGHGEELDFHAVQFDEHGNGIAMWESEVRFPPESFEGYGLIGDRAVRCLAAQTQMMTHTGYALQAKDLQDLRHLHEHFGVAYLAEQARYFAAGEQTGE